MSEKDFNSKWEEIADYASNQFALPLAPLILQLRNLPPQERLVIIAAISVTLYEMSDLDKDAIAKSIDAMRFKLQKDGRI